jgi:hypothetical protein
VTQRSTAWSLVGLLQVGVLLLDHFRYQATIPAGAWVAVIVIVAAQTYLILGLPETGRG